jgi:hypothetical protein
MSTSASSTQRHRTSLRRAGALLGSALLCVGACATFPVSGATLAPPTAAEEVLFYASSELGAPPLTGILVQDSTLRFVPIKSQVYGGVDSAAAPLVAALAQANEHKRPVSALGLSNRFRVASTDTLRNIFADHMHGWERFFSTFPTDRGFYGITAPMFSADSLSALIYVEYHCGGLCGEGALFLVRRDGGRWRTARRVRYWIS